MKVVILAGGYGTRLSEETVLRPKPMVEIGAEPILWHIMKIYYHYGFDDFIVCAGYKQEIIKNYFTSYSYTHSDVRIDIGSNAIDMIRKPSEHWKILVADTGLNTMTGGRIKRVEKYIGNETFMLTYGDGLSDINLSELLAFHEKHGRAATITAVRPTGRFGALHLDGDYQVSDFVEKPQGDGSWINGGFFVLNPTVFDTIEGDSSTWEGEPLNLLSRNRDLVAYKHDGFWRPMDTQSDRRILENLWASGEAPWKIWTD